MDARDATAARLPIFGPRMMSGPPARKPSPGNPVHGSTTIVLMSGSPLGSQILALIVSEWEAEWHRVRSDAARPVSCTSPSRAAGRGRQDREVPAAQVLLCGQRRPSSWPRRSWLAGNHAGVRSIWGHVVTSIGSQALDWPQRLKLATSDSSLRPPGRAFGRGSFVEVA